MAPSSFLLMPAEIRNKIYGLCTPINGPIEAYKGLLLASHQTQREYQSEAVQVMQRFLDSIQQQWPHPEELLFVQPSSFHDLAILTVQLPVSLYFPASKLRPWTDERAIFNTRMEDCLKPLYALYLAKLTFTYYANHGAFFNRHPTVVPMGLLFDMLNPLIPLRTPSTDDNPESLPRRRRFAFQGPVNVARIAYKWMRSRTGDTRDRYLADMANINFFLHESILFQWPEGLVRNWGHEDNLIWLEPRA